MSRTKQITKSGYVRLVNILKGLVPTVKTFGVITAFNPPAYETTPYKERQAAAISNKANKQLEKSIRSFGLGFIPFKDKYDDCGKSYFVPNIPKSFLKTLAIRYKQESIIYGEFEELEGKMIMTAELIFIYNAHYYNKQKLDTVLGSISTYSLGDTEKLHTEVNGREFYLDFIFKQIPDLWIADYGAIPITDSMSAALINTLNERANYYTKVGMYSHYMRLELHKYLYKIEGTPYISVDEW